MSNDFVVIQHKEQWRESAAIILQTVSARDRHIIIKRGELSSRPFVAELGSSRRGNNNTHIFLHFPTRRNNRMAASTTASNSTIRISLFVLQIFFFIIICVNSFTPSIQFPSVTCGIGSRRQSLVSMNLLPHKYKQGKIKNNSKLLDNVLDDIWTADDEIDNNQQIDPEQQSLNSLQKIDANTPQIITIDEDSDSSLDSTKWILISGTILILVAAGALAVTMGNDLGLDLELG